MEREETGRAWARWSPAAGERPWSVGVEEEVMLLDPVGWRPANRIDEVLRVLAPALASRTSAETHACVVELKSGAHPTVAGLAAEMEILRAALAEALAPLDLRAGVAGTHPLAGSADARVSCGARYRQIDATMRALAHREPTMALHVHVAVPDAAAAVRALDGLRGDLPVLLALSANSPFLAGSDSGFASMRTPIFSVFPRVGIPRHFGSYDDYIRVVDRFVSSGAVPEPGFLWWDVRLQPRYGTIEVRIMDAATRVTDVAALAALVQCLVRRHAESSRRTRALEPEVLAENRFLAARDGIAAALIDGVTGRRRHARDVLAEMLDASRPFAAALGCANELTAAAALAADPGDARQRRIAAACGLDALPERLSDAFAEARPALAAA